MTQSLKEQCSHRLTLDVCPLCGPNRRQVWYTDGGNAFHLVRDCPQLDAGQDKVSARGGVVSGKHRVRSDADRADEHFRNASRREGCQACVWGPH